LAVDQVERLYAQDRKKKEVIREMKEQEVYKEYTFQPSINKVSKALASDTRPECSNPEAK
jgi:hypothetical protein